jgi:hypothetical protein
MVTYFLSTCQFCGTEFVSHVGVLMVCADCRKKPHGGKIVMFERWEWDDVKECYVEHVVLAPPPPPPPPDGPSRCRK